MRSLSAAQERLFVVALALLAAVVPAGPAGAHTDFDYSLPTDGASVGNPVDEITVAFTLPVTLVGNGFEVLDPQENLLMPFAVTDDSTVFRLQLDPPLAGGTVGVRYTVTAEDGHALSGSFAFTVSVEAPPPTTTIAPTTVPEPTEPSTTVASPTESEPQVPTTTDAAAEPADSDVPVGAADEASATATAPDDSDSDNGGSSNSGLTIAIAGIVVVLAAGFVLVRSRRSAST